MDYKYYDGVTHQFFGRGAAFDEAKAVTKLAAKNLMKAFSRAANER